MKVNNIHLKLPLSIEYGECQEKRSFHDYSRFALFPLDRAVA